MSTAFPIQTSIKPYFSTIAAVGDSLTHAYSNGIDVPDYHPGQLATLLNAQGCNLRAINLGISGDTTQTYTGTLTPPGMIARLSRAWANFMPRLLVLYGGVNDDAHTANYIPVPGNVYDAITRTNLEAMATAAIAAGVPKVIICSRHPYNFASAGDVTAGAFVTPSIALPLANSYAAQRLAALNAVAAHPGKVAYTDLFTYFAANAVAAIQVGVDAYYHAGTGNIHLNKFGQSLIASANLATILAQPGWLADLAA